MTRTPTRKSSGAHRAVALDTFPGHCIRRLQQIAVAIFMQESAAFGATPVQFAVLHAVSSRGGIDQRTLARTIRFDTSTIGGVIDRLEARGLLTRSNSAADRRVRLLDLTADGEALLAELTPPMLRTQKRILEPLAAAERKEFMRMLQAVVGHHEALGDADAADS